MTVRRTEAVVDELLKVATGTKEPALERSDMTPTCSWYLACVWQR